MDWKLNATTGDLDTTGGVLGLIDGTQWVAQKLTIRYKFFQGEWFLDGRLGVPYFTELLEKGITDNVVRSILGRVALQTPTVINIENFRIVRDNANRKIAVSFRAITDILEGAPIDFSTEFII